MQTKQSIIVSLIGLLYVLLSITANAQQREFQWVKGGGGNAYYGGTANNNTEEKVRRIVVDDHGNSYSIVEIITGPAMINDSLVNLGTAAGANLRTANIISYTCDGKFRWRKTIYGDGDIEIRGLEINSLQQLVICGQSIHDVFSPAVDITYIDTVVTYSHPSSFAAGTWAMILDTLGNRKLFKEYEANSTTLSFGSGIVPTTMGEFKVPLGILHDTIYMIGIVYPEQVLCNVFPITYDGVIVDTNVDLNIGNSGHSIMKIDAKTLKLLSLDIIKASNMSRVAMWQEGAKIDDKGNFYLFDLRPANALTSPIKFNNIVFPFDSVIGLSIALKISPTGTVLAYKRFPMGKGGSANTSDDARVATIPISTNDGGVYLKLFLDTGVVLNGAKHKSSYINNHISDACLVKLDANTMDYVWAKSINSYLPQASQLFTNGIKLYYTVINNMTLNTTADTLKPFVTNNLYARTALLEIDSSGTYTDWKGLPIMTVTNANPGAPSSMAFGKHDDVYGAGSFRTVTADNKGHTLQQFGGNEDFYITKYGRDGSCNCTTIPIFPAKVSQNSLNITVNGYSTGTADSLVWFWGDGKTTKYLVQNTNISHIYATGGAYTVCLRSYSACGTKDSCFVVNITSSIETALLQQITIYPNPASNWFTIDNPLGSTLQVSIYNQMGQLQSKNIVNGNTNNIPTSQLPIGVYQVQLQLSNGAKMVRKVVKN